MERAEVAVVEARAPAADLVAAMGREGDLVGTRLARGCRCFLTCLGGGVAGYGWLSAAPEWIGEIGVEITPGPGEAYVWNCVTLPEHRRQGLFRVLLQRVVAGLRSEGLGRLWIASGEGGAERAVVDAGFVPVLRVDCWSVPRARMLRALPAPGAPPGLVSAGRAALGMPRSAALRVAAQRRH